MPARWLTIPVAIAVAVLSFAGIRELSRRARENGVRAKQAEAWGLERKASDRIVEITEREMRPLTESPLFRKRVEQEQARGKVDAKALGRVLVSRGIPRLSDGDLAALHSLRKRMILASDRACPCYWDPTSCTEGDIIDGLSRFTELELAAWSKLSATAGLAELAASAPVASTTSDFTDGLSAIRGHLPESDRTRLDQILDAKSPPPKAEQCFAMRAIVSGAETLSPAERTRFIRALANLGHD